MTTTIEIEHPAFKEYKFEFLGFNRQGSLAYYRSRNDNSPDPNPRNPVLMKIFRISRFGGSVHQIGEIKMSGLLIDDYIFDMKNQQIVFCGNDSSPWLELEDGNILLTLATFDLSNGITNWYYCVSKIHMRWKVMQPEDDDQLLMHYLDHSTDILHVYALSYLDSVNHTFGLSPFVNVPFYGALLDRYHFEHALTNGKGQITVLNFESPGEIFYFNLDQRKWFREKYVTEKAENFLLHWTYCFGLRIVEWLKSNNGGAFRFSTEDENQVWQLVFHLSVTPEIFASLNPKRCTADGKLVGFLRMPEWTRLKITMVTCVPCSLLEACISVLWSCSARVNTQLTDYEICDRLGLSKHVNMDDYFGKNLQAKL